jgi:hypothetical protein
MRSGSGSERKRRLEGEKVGSKFQNQERDEICLVPPSLGSTFSLSPSVYFLIHYYYY